MAPRCLLAAKDVVYVSSRGVRPPPRGGPSRLGLDQRLELVSSGRGTLACMWASPCGRTRPSPRPGPPSGCRASAYAPHPAWSRPDCVLRPPFARGRLGWDFATWTGLPTRRELRGLYPHEPTPMGVEPPPIRLSSRGPQGPAPAPAPDEGGAILRRVGPPEGTPIQRWISPTLSSSSAFTSRDWRGSE